MESFEGRSTRVTISCPRRSNQQTSHCNECASLVFTFAPIIFGPFIYLFISPLQLTITPQPEHLPDCRFLHYFRLSRRPASTTTSRSKKSTFQAALKYNGGSNKYDMSLRTYVQFYKFARNWRPRHVISGCHLSRAGKPFRLQSFTRSRLTL